MDDANFNNQVGPDPINTLPRREQPQLPVKPVFKKENSLHPLLKITLVFVIIFFIIISLFVVNVFLTENNSSQNAIVSSETEKTINVSSSATVYGTSEFAVVNIGIETSGTSLNEVVSQNLSKLSVITTAIKGSGIDNINTVEYSVAPKYQKSGENIVIASYVVKEVIGVKMPIEKVDSILQIALDSGANTISDLTFEVEDNNKLISDAKSAAIVSAEKEARDVARRLNVELGDLISYSDNNLINEGGDFVTANISLTYSIK